MLAAKAEALRAGTGLSCPACADAGRPSTAIPSITSLAADYGVAVLTVQKAIAILKDEGLLFGVPGKCTFVTEGRRS